jgi:ATP-dependent protease ClpP protease subunit
MELEVEYTRYVHIFDKEITKESVQELIDVLVGVPSVDLFFSTNGGEMSTMNALIHFINLHPDINVYLTELVASAGTFLLTDCTKPVYFSDDLELLLFHLGDRPVEGQFRKRKIDEKILYEQLKEVNNNTAEKFRKLGLTSKEIKSYLSGDDVILYRKDFNRLKINRK